MIRTASALLALGAVCLTAIAQSAAAQTLHEGYSHDPGQIVTYTRVDRSDIDPTSAAGAQVLLQRIETAADAVCGGEANAVSKSQKRDYANCRDDAISGAVSKMASAALKKLASRRREEMLAAR